MENIENIMEVIAKMTMCTSTGCQMREECYRTYSGSDDSQDYFNYEYTCNENSGFCDFISAKIYFRKRESHEETKKSKGAVLRW